MPIGRKAAASGSIVLPLVVAGWLCGQATPTGRAGSSSRPSLSSAATPGTSIRSGATIPATTASVTPAAPAAKAMPVAIGQKVEVKKGGSWDQAVVKNKGNGWILVNYTPGSFHEWVAPWRIRAVGSSDDNLPFIMPGDTLFKPAPPPADKPPEAPGADDRVAHAPREGRPKPGAGGAGGPQRPGNAELNHGVPDEMPVLPMKEQAWRASRR